MALSNPIDDLPETQSAFKNAYENWLDLKQRFIHLRQASDRISTFPTSITSSKAIVSALDEEIDDLEGALEEATYAIIHADDLSRLDTSALLQVLEADLKVRLLLDHDDPSLHLVRKLRSLSG